MAWEELKLEDIIKPDHHAARKWQEWLEERRQAEIKAQQEFHKILISWSSPSGLIPYAKPD
ncbi:unnamed protein product [marine sediment metagenome]|uniref:Uncharacterized protein n=1 Tax=marine sediment metagenome TaxID=412755 RepID=X0RH51_9ZZZZ